MIDVHCEDKFQINNININKIILIFLECMIYYYFCFNYKSNVHQVFLFGNYQRFWVGKRSGVSMGISMRQRVVNWCRCGNVWGGSYMAHRNWGGHRVIYNVCIVAACVWCHVCCCRHRHSRNNTCWRGSKSSNQCYDKELKPNKLCI